MWEEHPEYQKEQARAIGLIVLALFVLYTGWAVIHRDWDLLKTTLMIGGSLIAALGILSGSAWILVKILTRARSRAAQEKEPPNG
jgi:NAD/NADP transhydrogenase beta subunit